MNSLPDINEKLFINKAKYNFLKSVESPFVYNIASRKIYYFLKIWKGVQVPVGLSSDRIASAVVTKILTDGKY